MLVLCYYVFYFYFFFFFFQAEDGIRDLTVTGVQTCALPIYLACAPGGWGWCSTKRNERRTPHVTHLSCLHCHGSRGASVRRSHLALRPRPRATVAQVQRSEEHTSELQSQSNLVCRLLLEKKK